jgi:UDP-N-acetylglucosamine--N-acetylmuramyl-(pentapeptide) pyrophosphoryl-undecaprenol N-acetylglucosamine transferase
MTMVEAKATQINPIVLVAGGTGGHVFPAEALAGALRDMGHTLALLTDSRGAAWTGALGDVPTHAIRAGPVTGVALGQRLKGVMDVARGGLQSRKLLRRLAPSVVIGFGGYTTVPAIMAAASLRLPTIIHEQNALLGRANRLLAPRASAIATSFPDVLRLRDEDRPKAVRTGNPVRAAIQEWRDRPYHEPGRGGEIHLLVTGGSQGARIFSKVVPDAMARLADDMRQRIRLSQQCRPEDLDEVRATYHHMGLDAEVAPFFDDLAGRLGRAHLVVCRAGASTVAELTTAGRPSILVPYAQAADDHQAYNARAVADGGGAELIAEADFTPEVLAARLKLMLGQPGTLGAKAAAARAAGQSDAAGSLARLTARLIAAGDLGGNGREAA